MLGAAIVGVVLVGSATQGCGGSSGPSAADISSACNKACATELKCFPGVLTMDTCVSDCMKGAESQTGSTCTNQAAIVSAAEACANMTDCTALATCETNLPKCEGGGTAGASGGGTAGASGGGTAGASGGGTAGASGTSPGGTTCDTACAKADACSAAISALIHADAGTGSLKTLCDGQSAADQVSTVAGCNMVLTQAAAIPGTPAACQ
ncbi:MAG TPA: hypothetical protein VH560_02750 [Polyangia bacterium]|nr:hypothetical protein [Polyangia bacterium]